MEAEVVEALRMMRTSAEAHEQSHKDPKDTEPPFCIATRADLVATLMIELGLDIEDLGFIASSFLDLKAELECDCEGNEEPQTEEWPDKIGGE